MQVKQLIALSALALAGTAALADDITIDNTPFVSTRTRAEVKADVAQARAQGQLLAAGEQNVVAPTATGTALARATVKAEVLTARANGDLIPAGELLAQAHPAQAGKRVTKTETLAAR